MASEVYVLDRELFDTIHNILDQLGINYEVIN